MDKSSIVNDEGLFELFDKIIKNPKEDIQIILSELNISAGKFYDFVLELYFEGQLESLIKKDEHQDLENLLDELSNLVSKPDEKSRKGRMATSYQNFSDKSIVTKVELIEAMATDAGITKAAAKKSLESFLGNVEKSLKKGNRVSLVGFGSWSVSKRSAKEGRNPLTGKKTIRIAEKKVVRFKAGSDLSNSVN